jgi:hypothetical protein
MMETIFEAAKSVLAVIGLIAVAFMCYFIFSEWPDNREDKS